MHTNDPRNKGSYPEQGQGKSDDSETNQQQSDPPLTEIKGITEPEEYQEPEVEDESEDEKSSY